MITQLSVLPFALLLSVAVAQLSPRGVCNTSAEWELTPANYLAADTDNELRNWWTGKLAGQHTGFTTEFGKAFGRHVPYQCGLSDDSGCIYAGCSDFEDSGDPIWAYMTQISMVNLHILFKAIDEGITKGQLDFTGRIDKLVLTFFPWDEPNFAPEDALIWATGIAGVAGAVGPILAASRLAGKSGKASQEALVAGAGFGALAGAAFTQISDEINPTSLAGFVSLSTFKEFAADYGETTRSTLDTWANATFNGEKDASNYTFLDYFQGGAMVDHSFLPSASEIEAFFKKQLISAVINHQWRKRKIFTTFYRTNDTADASGPNATRYYSSETGGVYYTYAYKESGILKGYLTQPEGLDQLNDSSWGIAGSDITKSSAGSARIGRFNFTQDMAEQALRDAIASNGTLSPWDDGAGWRGTWTIPVCDMGVNNWNTQFGEKPSRYGMLPCCCGEGCKETKEFVEAANLKGFQTLLYGCEQQLKGTDLKFEDIDYGFKKKKSLPLYWATLSTAKKAGLAIGIIFGGFAAILMLLGCCGLCFGG